MKSNIVISHDWAELEALLAGRKVVAIVDGALETPYSVMPDLFGHLIPIIYIHASEEEKSLSTVESLISRLLALGADRDTFLLGVGGGITTDLVGFTASVYKRGIPFGFVPTTLLAQVDASIGGKNGVNFGGLKNMVGVIRQPEFVFINPDVLKTLPARTFRCGVAEMLKAFIIADREMFMRVARDGVASCLETFIRRAVEIKCEIVEKDEFENGLRRVLNLGHTFAHAIEQVCIALETPEQVGGDGIASHGDAVAVGTVIASKISCNMGILPKEEYDIIKSAFAKAGLPTSTDIPFEILAEAIAQDKKAQGGKINFVLPQSIGKVIVKPLSISELEDEYRML